MGSSNPKWRTRDPKGTSSKTGPSSRYSTKDLLKPILKSVGLLILAGASSRISQLAMHPVYGSIPSSIYHDKLTIVTVVLALTSLNYIPVTTLWRLVFYLPILAMSVPSIQFFLFKYSGQLGPVYGPLVTEIFAYCPVVFVSVMGASKLLDISDLVLDLSRYGVLVAQASPGIISCVIFSIAEKFFGLFIEQSIGSGIIYARSSLQIWVAAIYAKLLPSPWRYYMILPLLHTVFWNVHTPFMPTTIVLNSTLQSYDYVLVARHESVTGYISVLDSKKDGFRVMRCDHSLLGGEWTNQPRVLPSSIKEPIYAVFTMLEAVRLVEPFPQAEVVDPRTEKRALVM